MEVSVTNGNCNTLYIVWFRTLLTCQAQPSSHDPSAKHRAAVF